MIFIANARGDIQADLAPYAVNQGSDNANQIVFAAPIPQNATVTVNFKLPNGVVTLPYLLANIAQVQGIFDDKGAAYRCWSADIDYPITEIPGSVTAQFVIAYAATGGKPAVRHTTATVFTVNDGITYHPEPPDDPSDWKDLLTQIENAIATANMNKDEAERAITAADDAKKAAEDAKKAAEDAKVDADAAAADAKEAKEAAERINEVSDILDEAEKAAEETIKAASKVLELENDINEAKQTAGEAKDAIDNLNLKNGEGNGSVILINRNSDVPNEAVGNCSAVFGDQCIATGSRSFSGGYRTLVDSDGGFAWAWTSDVSSDSSVLKGTYAALFGSGNYAGPPPEGVEVDYKATGSSSFTEGWKNKNYGNQSHVENGLNEVRANSAHAGGLSCIIEKGGSGAFVHGYCLRTNKSYQAVFGQYNDKNDYSYLIVGDGTSDTDRHNLYEVGKDTTGRYIKLGDKKVYESNFNEGGGGGSDLNLENSTGVGSIKPKGSPNNASGNFSTIIAGSGNDVSGDNSVAEGDGHFVGAWHSHSGGQGNAITNEASASFVHGADLSAIAPYQAIFGSKNTPNANARLIVGNGTPYGASPSNLFEVGTDNNGVDYIALGGEVYRKDMLSRLIAKKKLRQVTEYVAGFANGGKLMVALDGAMVPVITYNYSTGKIRIEIAVTNPGNLDVFSDAPSALNAAGLPWGYTGAQITLDPGTSVYFGVSPALISTRGNGEAGEQMYATYEVSALYESIGGSTELQYTETTELFIRNSDEIYFEF